jgi:hypothetical protein
MSTHSRELSIKDLLLFCLFFWESEAFSSKQAEVESARKE